MSDIAVCAENLGKLYRIGKRERYRTLRDVIAKAFAAPPGRWRNSRDGLNSRPRLPASIPRPAIGHSQPELIWAVKDVSFEIKHGEVVGIIGRNGAGKSTLLKILSRITEPTEGEAKIYGRVGSLLEVGTGFHFELTGRENIYLNGAILGMKKAEIDRRFDEIVAFAEVGPFLDTPVKRYSSGMYLRLAFSVAAHLEPEILIVDEVLAVGDAAFQKKCLGKMGDVAKEGRTVMFVSHNMPAVLALCQKAMLLDSGRVIKDGTSSTVVEYYLAMLQKAKEVSLAERIDRRGNQALKFIKFGITNGQGALVQRVVSGQEVNLVLQYRSDIGRNLRKVQVSIVVHGTFDEPLFHMSTSVSGLDFEEIPAEGTLLCNIPCLCLQPGKYSFNLACRVGGEIADWIQNAGIVEVEAGDFFGSGKLPPSAQGTFLMKHSWAIISSRDPLKEDLNLEPSRS
jgi:lipopolysaccharide transport system ATP-binding protein